MQNALLTPEIIENYDLQLRHAWIAPGTMTGFAESLDGGQLKINIMLTPPNMIAKKYIITANGAPVLFQSTSMDAEVSAALRPAQNLATHFEILLDDIELGENAPLIEISARTECGGHEVPWYQRLWIAPSWGPAPTDDQMKRVGLRNPNPIYAQVLGASFHHKLKQLMEKYAGKSLYDCNAIMDWGCGYGRLARFFPPQHRAQVTGTDIDRLNIEWAQKNMPDINFQTVPTQTPTQFADGQFDLVYGNSVFTHLAEADQFAWLVELQRITRPGGIVAVTVHAHIAWSFLGWHNSEGIIPLLTKGFRESGITNPDVADVVGDFYTDVHHTHDYILREWSRYFDVLDILEAFSGRQAMVVLRRR